MSLKIALSLAEEAQGGFQSQDWLGRIYLVICIYKTQNGSKFNLVSIKFEYETLHGPVSDAVNKGLGHHKIVGWTC